MTSLFSRAPAGGAFEAISILSNRCSSDVVLRDWGEAAFPEVEPSIIPSVSATNLSLEEFSRCCIPDSSLYSAWIEISTPESGAVRVIVNTTHPNGPYIHCTREFLGEDAIRAICELTGATERSKSGNISLFSLDPATPPTHESVRELAEALEATFGSAVVFSRVHYHNVPTDWSPEFLGLPVEKLTFDL
ncbi:MAG: hypothetical protein KDD55_07345 [Bdellovibrionales bacterium]|nr:hypothetical protein [Bdellovibrionales bacterium]